MKDYFIGSKNYNLLKDVGNLRQGDILNFLLYQPKTRNELKHQHWKQSYLAELFMCHKNSILKDLETLQENGWIKYHRGNYGQLTTTNIELTEKTLKYRTDNNTNEPKHTKKVEIKKNTLPPKEKINAYELTPFEKAVMQTELEVFREVRTKSIKDKLRLTN